MIGAFYAKDSKSTTSRRVFLSHDAVLHSFIAPKARRREHGVNFQRNYLPCIEPYETILSNVKGDGRCGYRALALWLQTTVEDVMKTLAEIMVKEPRTTVRDSGARLFDHDFSQGLHDIFNSGLKPKRKGSVAASAIPLDV